KTMGVHINTQRSSDYLHKDDGRRPASNRSSSTKDNQTRCLPLSSIPCHLSGIVHRPSSIVHRPYKGQASVIIGLSIFLLILVVGLAIDGGSVYNQRRQAQNSADSAALAGTKVMLDAYDQMILNYTWDVDGTEADDRAINDAITAYANL